MRSRRYTLGSYVLAVTLLVPVVSPGLTPGASAESSVRTILQGFESQGSDVSVSTDNLRFRDGRPFVGLKRVRYVPARQATRCAWTSRSSAATGRTSWSSSTRGSLEPDRPDAARRDDEGRLERHGRRAVGHLMMKMTNGSFWGVSFAVTDQWKTYSFPLDPAGTDWYSSGPDWGWKDRFTLDQIAYITFFVSPPETGTYSLWFDDLSVSGGPLQSVRRTPVRPHRSSSPRSRTRSGRRSTTSGGVSTTTATSRSRTTSS